MSKQHTYVLGLNTYDHDVSACLLRDGAIAVAIAKERITREKHASGFYKEVIDYCLSAEGIGMGDIDLVVSNCYILPVPEMEERLIYQDMPGFLPPPVISILGSSINRDAQLDALPRAFDEQRLARHILGVQSDERDLGQIGQRELRLTGQRVPRGQCGYGGHGAKHGRPDAHRVHLIGDEADMPLAAGDHVLDEAGKIWHLITIDQH